MQPTHYFTKTFYDLATAARVEIDTTRPDLILVLAHGAWPVLWALETLWNATRNHPLPPVIVLNIGREKLERYLDQRPQADWVHTYPYVADYAGEIENGYFLAWLTQQTDLVQELRDKTSQSLSGIDPQRILVLDDGQFSGGTHRLSLGLLDAAYPNATSQLLTADTFEWKEDLATIWLQQAGITLEHLDKPISKHYESRVSAASKIIAGTQDTSPDSLDWQPITANNLHVATLCQFLPLEQVLALPIWLKQMVQNGAEKHMQAASPSTTRILHLTLDPYERLLKHLWINRQLTAREAALLLGISTQKATRMLMRLVEAEVVEKKSKGRETNYLHSIH